jgi:hypothetical protein
MMGQLPGPGPYSVVCPGTVGGDEPSTFSALRDALCWAQNTADAYDAQCLVTDRLGNSMELRRGSSFGPSNFCPFPRDPARSPLAPEPFFHPNPEHPRSRRRFLRNEPESFVPGGGDPSPVSARPRDFFGGNLPLMASPSLVSQFRQELLLLLEEIRRLPSGTRICAQTTDGQQECDTREEALAQIPALLSSDLIETPEEDLNRWLLMTRAIRQSLRRSGSTVGILVGSSLIVGTIFLMGR